MKTFSLTALVVTLGFALGAAPSTQPSPQQQIDDLKSKVSDLEAQVTTLKAQVEQRDKTIAGLARSSVVSPFGQGLRDFALRVPPSLQEAEHPRGWTPYQFNGSTYYVVPLEGGKLRAITTAAPSGTLTIQNATVAPSMLQPAPAQIISGTGENVRPKPPQAK